MDFVKQYTDWLNKNITQSEISENLYEITVPFLDRHNDYMQIYIDSNNEKDILIHDYGYILDDLSMSGFDINTPKRKEILNLTLKKFSIQLDDRNYLNTRVNNINDLPDAKHRLIESMIYINDMFTLNKNNTLNLFMEDVRLYFDNNNIYYSEDIKFSGKSSFIHTFDYSLQRNKYHPERLLRLMNNPNRKDMFSSIMFSWEDTKPTRKNDTELIVLLNDNNKVSSEILNGFNNYSNDGVKSIMWSKIDSSKELLA